MNSSLVTDLYQRIDALPIIDTHTHIEWQTPTANNIGEILSYHYYTELVNSTRFEREPIPFDDPEELTKAVLPVLGLFANTVQHDWLMTISREFLEIAPSEWRPDNWRHIYERSVSVMGRTAWRNELIARSGIARVFLTNRYDDDLDGLDESLYTPCLRTEPFVLSIHQHEERDRMATFLGRSIRSISDFVAAVDKAFAQCDAHGMGYAALSAPPNLRTYRVASEDAQRILSKAIEGTDLAEMDRDTWASYAMCRVCEACRKYDKPYHLMVGVDRQVYKPGVPGGMDLFDSANSLRGYDFVLNTYWDVRFPIAVLADTTGLELVAAAWIRHNVFPSGHWWYGNQPIEIRREIGRRIDVVPQNKLIGYFSDAYYLEFILPKYRMFKFELACALADRIERSRIHPNMEPFGVDEALEMAEGLLIHNPCRIIELAG